MVTNALRAKISSRDSEEQSSLPTIPLKVTRPSSSAADHAAPELGKPLFRGTGDTDYVCGNCGAVIAASMGPAQRAGQKTSFRLICGPEAQAAAPGKRVRDRTA